MDRTVIVANPGTSWMYDPPVLALADGQVRDVTVVILTYNEAAHIERAIASVRGFARDILVVDSHSTDGTVRLARAMGARVLQNAFVNQAVQFDWAMANGAIATGWTLRLDADEIIERDLAEAIVHRLPELPDDVTGIVFERKHIFMGRWVRHGARYPLRMLRLFRTGHGRIEQRWMDEHIVVTSGRAIIMGGGFADANELDLSFFTDKHNRYATREAIEVLSDRYGLLAKDDALSGKTASRQASFKRWFKDRIYNRLPMWAGPLAYFLYRYILRLGFLDGKTGTMYHVLQGFWYRYLVACKVFEFDREIRHCKSRHEALLKLSELTSHQLTSEKI